MDGNQNFNDNMKRKIFRMIFTVAAMFVLSFAVLFLWNAILPQTIHVSVINYWEALALLVLSRLLFGNFHFGLPWGRERPVTGNKPGGEFLNMNDKDKTTFKDEWKRRCEKWGSKEAK